MLHKSLLNYFNYISCILDVIDKLEPAKQKIFYIDKRVGMHIRHMIDHIISL